MWINITKNIGNGCIKYITKLIHCNADHPENSNIYLNKSGDKYIMIYKQNKWIRVNTIEFITNYIMDSRKRILQMILNKIGTTLTYNNMQNCVYQIEYSIIHEESRQIQDRVTLWQLQSLFSDYAETTYNNTRSNIYKFDYDSDGDIFNDIEYNIID